MLKSEPKPFASLSSGLLARKGSARPAMRPQGFGQSGSGLDDLGWNDMGFEAPQPVLHPITPDANSPLAVRPNPVTGLSPISPVHAVQEEIEQRLGHDGYDEDEDVADNEDVVDETAELMPDYAPPLDELLATPVWADENVPAPTPIPLVKRSPLPPLEPSDYIMPESIDFGASEPMELGEAEMAPVEEAADEPMELGEAEMIAAPMELGEAELLVPFEPAQPEPVAAAPVLDARPVVAPAPVAMPAPRGRKAGAGKLKAAFTLRLDADRHLKLRLACAVTGTSAQQLVTRALDELLATMPELDAMAARAPERFSSSKD